MGFPILFSPSVIGLLGYSESTADLLNRFTLRQPYLCLTKHPDDLLNTVSLAFHPDLPLESRYCHILTQNLDHFLGGRLPSSKRSLSEISGDDIISDASPYTEISNLKSGSGYEGRSRVL